MKTIGTHMREARMEASISRPELSKLAGVPETSIRAYETSEAFPGIINLIALADALNMSIDDYIGHRIKG